ncbi:DUF2750 domain-containing protein [Alteromonas halophila]|uniref:DUF2750 domain-containing protein n=1 Tax=Alteromonas halophila TaxID=516698 RepID=A0A918JN33_9ALTE|nr:DUF2750 domain-containing protein [Alteromonas halophila]GGW89825.1 hypothetical protein GCM10007391_25180 [Alteromonas halophila]
MVDEQWLSGTAQSRVDKSLARIREQQSVWILTDEHGCVMLTTEDEEGVPVWPQGDLAALWATDEWAHCEPLAISLKDWLEKWTGGMLQDDLMVMVCPLPGEDGEVLDPEDFAQQLTKA